jgi:hypothetical protein
LPGTFRGRVMFAETDPSRPASKVVIAPGATSLLDVSVFFAAAPAGEAHPMPLSMCATVVLLDELHGEHATADVACRVSMQST